MKQLSGLDNWFLSIEGPTSVGHVTSVVIVDPSTSPEPWTFDRFKRHLSARIDRLDPFTHRLVEVPLGIDFPYWIRDDSFDLDYHARHVAVPGERGREEFADLVARIHARPLDRSRPLWEVYLVDGLPEGHIGVLTKLHHAAIDGLSGLEILASLVDLDPNTKVAKSLKTPKRRPTQPPGPTEMLVKTARNLALSPKRLLRATSLLASTLPVVGEAVARTAEVEGISARPMDLVRRFGTAPRTPFNASIGPHRRWAYVSVPLADLKAIKNKADATVNDVLLTLVSGVLRNWLEANNELPDRPLSAMVPLSVRGKGDPSQLGNAISSVVTTLATHLEDPSERLRVIKASMTAAKEAHGALPADVLTDLTQVAPAAVAALASRMVASTRLADRMTLPFNLVVSNVPASPIPSYLAGAQIVRHYPVSAIVDGVGLNVTAVTTNDMVDIGFVSDRDLIPDLWSMADAVPTALDALRKSVGLRKRRN